MADEQETVHQGIARERQRRDLIEEQQERAKHELATLHRQLARINNERRYGYNPDREKERLQLVLQAESVMERQQQLKEEKRELQRQIDQTEQVLRKEAGKKRDIYMLPSTEEAILGAHQMLARWKREGVIFKIAEEKVYSEVSFEAARIRKFRADRRTEHV